MAYDYSQEFLVANRDIIDQMKELARSGSIGTLKFEYPKDMQSARRTILNCLAVMAHIEPELKNLRDAMRTWSEYADGHWVLYVGIPKHRLPGGRPKHNRKFQVRLEGPNVISPPDRNQWSEVVFGEVTQANWPEFYAKLVKVLGHPEVKTVVGTFPTGFPHQAFNVLAGGWDIETNEETMKATFTKKEIADDPS